MSLLDTSWMGAPTGLWPGIPLRNLHWGPVASMALGALPHDPKGAPRRLAPTGAGRRWWIPCGAHVLLQRQFSSR